jgi:hypothetical protein
LKDHERTILNEHNAAESRRRNWTSPLADRNAAESGRLASAALTASNALSIFCLAEHCSHKADLGGHERPVSLQEGEVTGLTVRELPRRLQSHQESRQVTG